MLDLWITQLDYYKNLYQKNNSVVIPIFFKSNEIDNINDEIIEYFKTEDFLKYIKIITNDDLSSLKLIVFLNKNWKEEDGFFYINEKKYNPLWNTGILFKNEDIKYPENTKYILYNFS